MLVTRLQPGEPIQARADVCVDTGYSQGENNSGQSRGDTNSGHSRDQWDTLSGSKPHPEYLKKGPIITQKMFEDANWPNILNIPRPLQSTRFPNPTATGDAEQSKQTGPPAVRPFTDRPVRSTRNPKPLYVDGVQLVSHKPWSASWEETQALNRAINARCP